MVEGSSPTRVLFAAPFAPRLDAHHGGSRAIAHLLSALVGRLEVGLLYLRGPDEPELDPALASCCAWSEAVPRGAPEGRPFARISRRARLVRGLLDGRPAWVTRWAVPDYARRLRAMAREWAPAVVQLDFHVMGQYLEALRDCPAPRMLVEHEPGIAAAREHWSRASGFERVVARWDLAAWERFEPPVLRSVQAIVVFTERDRAAIAALAPETPVIRIPLGASIPAEPLDPVGAEPPSLLFVGNYVHPPNVDAAVRLATGIFQAVRESCPGARLYLVGASPPAVVRRLATPRIVVTGEVSDVTSYLDRAAVVVVPLRMGGGMRIKVLEALAAGKAVVASRRATEGLDLIDGEQLILAETDAEFARAIEHLLADPARRRSLAAGGREWSHANVGWDRIASAYHALYRSLTHGAQPGQHLDALP
jgi:glycosyltransferase involved in cell wall biosynthesis